MAGYVAPIACTEQVVSIRILAQSVHRTSQQTAVLGQGQSKMQGKLVIYLRDRFERPAELAWRKAVWWAGK